MESNVFKQCTKFGGSRAAPCRQACYTCWEKIINKSIKNNKWVIDEMHVLRNTMLFVNWFLDLPAARLHENSVVHERMFAYLRTIRIVSFARGNLLMYEQLTPWITMSFVKNSLCLLRNTRWGGQCHYRIVVYRPARYMRILRRSNLQRTIDLYELYLL